MTSTTVQAGFDTWAGSVKPAMPHGDEKGLHVASGTERAFLHAANPATPDSTVLTALFTVYAKGASTGSRTLTLRRIIVPPGTEPWKARTLNWNNQPAVTDTGMVTVTVGALADKDPISFDVTALLQSDTSGTTKNYGWRISTSGTDHSFYSAQSGVKNPTLTVEYVEGPGVPTNLSPAGGLVGVAQPTLSWDYTGADDLASYRVQTDPSADETTPDYDSGVLAATAGPMHPLAGTAFADLATNGASTYWRVQVTDVAGQTSDWSDWVSMLRDDKGTLTLNNPAVAPNNFVTEPTPPILFTLADETLTAFRVLITQAADRTKIVVDSGKQAGATGAWTVPTRRAPGRKKRTPYLLSGGSYSLCVRAFDTKQRQGSKAAGDQPYVEVWRDFTMLDTAGVTSPVATSVTQYGVTPAATVTFTRGTAPDEFVVLRDGVEIAVGLLPGDLFVSGTTYAWQDWTAHPGTAHAYTVKAVVNGVQSNPSSAVALVGGTKVEGVWVIDPDTGLRFVLAARAISGDWKQVDVGTTYQPIGGQSAFRVTQVLGGLSGTVAGALNERTDTSVLAQEADLWAMKADAPHSPGFRLVADTKNIPVQVYDLACAPSETTRQGFPRRQVSFSFTQTGEFEFDGQV